VGDAEWEIVIRESSAAPEFSVVVKDNRQKVFPARPTNRVLAAEHEAFESMLPQLMERFAGYVAIRDGKVVAVGDSEIDVLTAAHQQYPGKSVYARLVTPPSGLANCLRILRAGEERRVAG
jgi:phosphoglycolate phosphatase-like HAD superfamily hydrolase